MIEPTYVRADHNGDELSKEDRETIMSKKVRPDNFTKINWKNADSRDQWSDFLSDMASAKQLAEWRSVLSDETDRKAAIIHLNNYNREEWLRRIGDEGLHYRDIRYTAPYNGFAHEFKGTDKNDPERLTYAVISDNPDTADKMEEAELEMGGFERHDTVGELLGFPECCREWFWENWGLSNKDNQWTDPMYEIACNTDSATAIDGNNENVLIDEIVPWTNILYRYWGQSFITHMPCSFDCEHSADIGETRGEIMAEYGYKDAANAMWQWLSLPMVWESRLGIAQVTNEHWIGSANSSGYWSMKRIVWGEEHEMGSVV